MPNTELPQFDALFVKPFAIMGSVYSKYIAGILEPLEQFLPALITVKTILTILALLFFAGIVFTVFRMREINKLEKEYYKPIDIEESEAKARIVEWEVIMDHLNADNPAEWRIAVLEADNILDRLLAEEGFQGENLGERLKGLTTKNLVTLNEAWEAHKVRNNIAHDGSTFTLENRHAKQVIGMYEKVFRELGYL